MRDQALGLIETYGYVGAVEAADVCLKAANVEMIGCVLVKGGLVTIMIGGDVGAVQASVDAGAAAASRVGSVISVDVIARSGEGLGNILYSDRREQKIEHIVPAEGDREQPAPAEGQNRRNMIETTVEYKGKSIDLTDVAALESMKVVDLRRVARNIEGFPIERGRIKFSKKQALIEAITSCCRNGGET